MGEVVEFPARRQRHRWRQMTSEECLLVLQFADNIVLLGSSPFARSMVEAARAGRLITDKQGAAIFEVARDWGLGPVSVA